MKNKSITISIATLACAAIAGSASAISPFGKTPVAGNPNAQTDASPKKTTATAKASAKQLSAQDKTFMMNAAKGGMMEVEMGKMAAEHAQNADVKKFGNRMVTDHGKANNELMALAKADGVSLPAAKSPGKWKSDKAYMDEMVKDHEKDLAEFQKEAQSGNDADLKKFASKTAKIIQKHLEMAKDIQGKLK